MRIFMLAAVAAFSMGLMSVSPANAWQCVGPEYVCGDAKKASPSAAVYKSKQSKLAQSPKAYKKKSNFAHAEPRAYKPKKKAVNYSTVYSGGSSHQSGVASYYWQPQRVASGGWFNPNAMTAAHKSLPFGTKVRVTHMGNGRSVTVTINDRGPYIKGRIIDLSSAAAGVIGMKGSGIARVQVAVIGKN